MSNVWKRQMIWLQIKSEKKDVKLETRTMVVSLT